MIANHWRSALVVDGSALYLHPSKSKMWSPFFTSFRERECCGVFDFSDTNQSERYDSLFFMEYTNDENVLFQSASQKLGVTRSYELPYTTEPKVLEYKYSFDSLIDDFDKEEKFVKQIDFVVCWTAGSRYKSKFYLHPLLVGDEGSSRQMFGATHQAFATGAQGSPAFEVLILEDLLNWIQDEAGEEARQKRTYRDA